MTNRIGGRRVLTLVGAAIVVAWMVALVPQPATVGAQPQAVADFNDSHFHLTN